MVPVSTNTYQQAVSTFVHTMLKLFAHQLPDTGPYQCIAKAVKPEHFHQDTFDGILAQNSLVMNGRIQIATHVKMMECRDHFASTTERLVTV